MMNLCGLLGHRRDKRRARWINNTWRSKCERCDAALERDASGKWTHTFEKEIPLGFVRPDLESPVDPFSRQALPQSVDDPWVAPPLPKANLPRDLVNELVPQTPAGNDNDRFYYIARAEEARLLAEAASEHRVKVIHLEMVERYYTLAYHCLGQPARISQRRIAGTKSLRAPAGSESGL